jgi:hypothetical protein
VVHFRRCCPIILTHINIITVKTHGVALACQCHKFSPGLWLRIDRDDQVKKTQRQEQWKLERDVSMS